MGCAEISQSRRHVIFVQQHGTSSKPFRRIQRNIHTPPHARSCCRKSFSAAEHIHRVARNTAGGKLQAVPHQHFRICGKRTQSHHDSAALLFRACSPSSMSIRFCLPGRPAFSRVLPHHASFRSSIRRIAAENHIASRSFTPPPVPVKPFKTLRPQQHGGIKRKRRRWRDGPLPFYPAFLLSGSVRRRASSVPVH